MNAAASARGWTVLWPEQSLAAHELRCWNWFRSEHQRRDEGEPAMLASLIREQRAERVFLAGISAGAAMTAILAVTYPELFDAVAMHSGVAYGAARNVAEGLAVMRSGALDVSALAKLAHETMGPRAKPMPALVLHGGKDAALNPRNGTNLARQFALANAIVLGKDTPQTAERLHREDGRYDAHVVTYEGVEVEEWRIPRLGHAWSGGDPAATYTDPNGPDATAAVVEFFSRRSSRS
jgi:poly(hydroxyalkanoate) depolymerase family esterase